jgi:hypothetical protein
MNYRNSIFKRAASFLAALFFTQLTFALKKSESAADIIEKAQNLSLQKERSQAVLILVNATKREIKKNPQAAKELIVALDKISSVFYSDKAQQLFELSLSLKNSDINLAINRLQEAQKMEPENLSILLEIGRNLIIKNECDQAVDHFTKYKEINPFSEDVELAFAQALVCAGKFETYRSIRQKAEDKKGVNFIYWGTVDAEYHFKSSQNVRAKDICRSILLRNPHYPEPYFCLWRVENNEEMASKYLNLCKGISVKSQREFIKDPQLCRRVSEVEVFIKKFNNQTK